MLCSHKLTRWLARVRTQSRELKINCLTRFYSCELENTLLPFSQLDKLPDLIQILLSIRLDSATNIQRPRLNLFDPTPHVLRVQSTRQHNRQLPLSLCSTFYQSSCDGPIKHLTRTTTERFLARSDLGIEQRDGKVPWSSRLLQSLLFLLVGSTGSDVESLDDGNGEQSSPFDGF